MLLVHHIDHLFPADSESGAGSNGSGRCQTQPGHCRQRPFSHKLARRDQREGSFLPTGGNNCNFCAAVLEIKNGVRGISLRIEGFLRRELDDGSPQAGARQKGGGIELGLFKFNH